MTLLLKEEYSVLRVFAFVCSLFACIVMAMNYNSNGDGKNYDGESYGFNLSVRCVMTVCAAAQITRHLSPMKLPTGATQIRRFLLVDYCIDQVMAYNMLLTAAYGEFLAKRMRKEEGRIFIFANIMAFFSTALCALISGYNLSNYRNFSITNS